jgi:hypothetical protein
MRFACLSTQRLFPYMKRKKNSKLMYFICHLSSGNRSTYKPSLMYFLCLEIQDITRILESNKESGKSLTCLSLISYFGC